MKEMYVTKVVCAREVWDKVVCACVTTMCVKERCVEACVYKSVVRERMVCDKVVGKRLCVTEMYVARVVCVCVCDRDVFDKSCLCVNGMYVTKVVCERDVCDKSCV